MPKQVAVTLLGEVKIVTVSESSSAAISNQLNELIRSRVAYLVALKNPEILEALATGITITVEKEA